MQWMDLRPTSLTICYRDGRGRREGVKRFSGQVLIFPGYELGLFKSLEVTSNELTYTSKHLTVMCLLSI